MNVYHNGFIYQGVENKKPSNEHFFSLWKPYVETFPKIKYLGSQVLEDYQEVIEGEDYIKQHQLKSANPGKEEWYTPFYLEDFHNTTDMSQKRIVAISAIKKIIELYCERCGKMAISGKKIGDSCNRYIDGHSGKFCRGRLIKSILETKEPNEPADINGPEYILCAATWYKEQKTAKILPRNIKQGVVLCGYRHGDIIHQFVSLTGKRSVLPECGEYEQGFITNKNRFVGRKEAFSIARDAEQIKGPNKGQSENSIGLTSEDLY